jgi:hypothetical protein
MSKHEPRARPPLASVAFVLVLALVCAGGGLSSGGGPASSSSYSLVIGSIGQSLAGVTSNAGQVMTAGLVPRFFPASTVSQLALATGWNLVGVPAPLPATSIPGFATCYGFTGDWFAVTGSDTPLPGNGYWVEVAASATVTVEPPYASSPFTVEAAAPWHLLGNPFEVDVPVNTIAGNEHFQVIYGYGPTWFSVDLVSGVLEPGRGYWVQLDVPTTLALTRSS